MALARIDYSITRKDQLVEGVGPNQIVRASDYNKIIDFLNTLNSLPAYNDDSGAATGGLAIGSLYRTGSTIKVRVS